MGAQTDDYYLILSLPMCSVAEILDVNGNLTSLSMSVNGFKNFYYDTTAGAHTSENVTGPSYTVSYTPSTTQTNTVHHVSLTTQTTLSGEVCFINGLNWSIQSTWGLGRQPTNPLSQLTRQLQSL
eukprot:gnl/Chilomastix_caulleri/1973.p1 GENE.gnl/Chilomastix_caulleri/1973~~gnl/Chilomastix_caulleri/1973.p1  ORF type:complete len:125 (+),score=12.10 gnl/Chilomastix_caulleri/1973:201-575(+)